MDRTETGMVILPLLREQAAVAQDAYYYLRICLGLDADGENVDRVSVGVIRERLGRLGIRAGRSHRVSYIRLAAWAALAGVDLPTGTVKGAEV